VNSVSPNVQEFQMISQRRSRFICRIAGALAFFALLAPTVASADDLPTRCQGTDMLAELQVKSPDVYSKVMAESSALPNTEAVLWKVEKSGIPPSYLFGTMHLSDPRIAMLSPAVKDAIAHSKS